MKRALKYLLETKGSDYDQYRSCFKSYTNENMGNISQTNIPSECRSENDPVEGMFN